MVLLLHLANSLWRLVLGFAIASIVGIGTGLVLNRSRLLRQASNLMMSSPSMIWIPLLTIFLGTGSMTVIAIVFLASVFAIAYETVVGVGLVAPEIIEAAMLDGASGAALVFGVTLPCAWTHVVAGLRLGIGYALRGLIGAEMVAATLDWGLGKLLFRAWFWHDLPTALSALGVTIIVGVVFDTGMRRWQYS